MRPPYVVDPPRPSVVNEPASTPVGEREVIRHPALASRLFQHSVSEMLRRPGKELPCPLTFMRVSLPMPVAPGNSRVACGYCLIRNWTACAMMGPPLARDPYECTGY